VITQDNSQDYRKRSFYKWLYTPRSFKLILVAWRILGKRGAWIISRSLALAFALLHPQTIRSIRSNIALLDPSRAGFWAAFRLLVNQSECISSYGRLATVPPSELLDLLGEQSGIEHLRQLHKEGRGCLLVTGHLGFFEIGGPVMTTHGFPMTVLTYREPTPELTQWRADFRSRWGVGTVVVGSDPFSVIGIVQKLREGHFVAMLADRPYNAADALPVDLPNGRIPFSNGPALLSILTGTPVVPVGITTGSDGKFRIESKAPILPPTLVENREEAVALMTRQIAASMIPMFLRDPEQWYHFAPLAIPASGEASPS
jgi:KDO2-lipid IV(A) lauroyltransferase